MRHQQDDKINRRHKQNMKFLDDRYELLETISKLIDEELDRRLGDGLGRQSPGRKDRGLRFHGPKYSPCALCRRLLNFFRRRR